MLNWAKQFNIFCFLDNQQYSIQPHYYECLLAGGATDAVASEGLKEVDAFLKKHSNWTFGHLSYDLKDPLHHLSSHKANRIGFPRLHLFVPEVLLLIKEGTLQIMANDAGQVYQAILHQPIDEEAANGHTEVRIQQKLTKGEYVKKIERLKAHILRGDCYEINFCQEFFSDNATLDPFAVYQQLMTVSPNPFSALYRMDDKYLICASPERFLQKQGDKMISQPIKGTIKRNLQDNKEDEALKNELKGSQKDQSENVMVVDLVRNDLSMICKRNTVTVKELFGIYSFPQVHQMISTISGEVKQGISFSEIVQATFPMGSMTGAPKRRVMELIEEYEEQSRGIFSGSVGYITPGGDFDWNVVIRSIMYNATEKYLSYQVGSGITFYSDPEKEWEECLLKPKP
jgi:para-aminobenzoate synthetase component 1